MPDGSLPNHSRLDHPSHTALPTDLFEAVDNAFLVLAASASLRYSASPGAFMYRFVEYLHLPEIAAAAFFGRLRHRRPASRISFGPDRHQEAYFLRPERSAQRKRPLIIYIHGGGWRRGHPRYFRFIGRFFARQGYPVLLCGYRLGPRHQFEEQLADIHTAVEHFFATPWAKLNRPRSAVVIGQSAGGHLGAHLAFAPAAGLIAPAAREGSGRPDHAPGNSESIEILGFVSISGVLSLRTGGWRYLERLIRNTARHPETRRAADPLDAMSAGRRRLPTLLVHGRADRIVPEAISRGFARKYEEVNGALPGLLLIPWARHNELGLIFLGRRPRLTAFLLQWLAVLGEQRGKRDEQ